MATTTKINATSTKHGYASAASYAYEGSIYIGKTDSGDYSRTRITVPSLRSIAAIGDNTIVITKVTLRMYRRSGGPVNVAAAVSSSGAWTAAADGGGSATVSASNGWYEIDLTSCAETILNYSSPWYIHLSGTGSRVRCYGASDSSNLPHINVVWEYSANTLTTDVESVELGAEVSLNIAPEANDARYELTYEFGDDSGTIADTVSTTVKWTPPVSLAAEIPDAEAGEVKITMRVYDSGGAQLRTEILYLTVTVPDSMVVAATFTPYTVNGLGYTSGASSYSAALAGKSAMRIAPKVDITGAYGATVVSLKAELDNGGSIQIIEWASLTETDAGVFEGEQITGAILANAGTVKITLTATDSRGREATAVQTINVHAYSNPAVTGFAVERYEAVYDNNEQITGYAPSDVGENVWVTLKASCTNVVASGESRNFLTWKITAKAADGTETTYSGGGTAQAVDIYEDRTVITALVSAAAAVDYTVEVSDTAGYSAYQYDSVVPGRANFALAPSKFGASFGCLPKGTEANPMLESAYPFYAYAGIEGVNNFAAGEVKTGGTWIDGKPIYRNVVSANYTASASAAVATIEDLDTVIDINGVLYDGGGACYPLTFYWTSSNYQSIYVNAADGVIVKGTRNLNGYIILYYTKTTD